MTDQRKLEIIKFLALNGYVEDSEKGSVYRSFFKEGVSSIDVNDSEIVFIGESGDWLNIPMNLYALIGALIHYKEIATNYKNHD